MTTLPSEVRCAHGLASLPMFGGWFRPARTAELRVKVFPHLADNSPVLL